MSVSKSVLVEMESAQFDEVLSKFRELLEAFEPLSTSLSSIERVRFRNIGQRRKGFVDDVLDAAEEFDIYLPKDIDIAGLRRKASLHDRMRRIQNISKLLVEKSGDNAMSIGDKIMNEVDLVYSALKAARSRDTGLEKLMQSVEIHYSRSFNGEAAVSEDPAPELKASNTSSVEENSIKTDSGMRPVND